jgi:hypothetical protein
VDIRDVLPHCLLGPQREESRQTRERPLHRRTMADQPV